MLLAKTFLRAGLLLFLSALAAAQAAPSPTTAPPPQQANTDAGEDADPTRPVAWSLREEYYNLRGETWNNVLIFRVDRAFLKGNPVTWKRGILTRFDIPAVVAVRPDGTRGGLGDIYAQALWLPYFKKQRAFAVGSGISLPTATDSRLGTGKLTLAPAVVPVWFIPRRGFAFVKVQDYISVAGAGDRPDLHYLTVTPLLLWRFKGKPYWVQFDAESKTDWKADGHTGYKVGFLFGRMMRKRFGAWIKTEVGLGPYRDATLAIKTSLFKVR